MSLLQAPSLIISPPRYLMHLLSFFLAMLGLAARHGFSLVAEHGLSCSLGIVGTSSLARMELYVLCIRKWIPNHCTTMEAVYASFSQVKCYLHSLLVTLWLNQMAPPPVPQGSELAHPPQYSSQMLTAAVVALTRRKDRNCVCAVLHQLLSLWQLNQLP